VATDPVPVIDPDPPLKTPDFTPEAIVALLVGAASDIVALFVLDFSDAQKAAISGLITAVVLAAFLIHSAVVRHGRALGNTSRNR